MTIKTQSVTQKHDRVFFFRNLASEFPPKWQRFIGTVTGSFTTFGGDLMIEVTTDDGYWFILRPREVYPWRFSEN